MENLNLEKNAGKVWNPFMQMKTYLDYSPQILQSVDQDNYFTNAKGDRLYDGMSTMLNTNVGHCNPEIIKAIDEQLNQLDNTTMLTSTSDIAIKCSKKLCSLTDNHFYATFFTNSGSESCDTAIKIIRKYWKNKGVEKNGIVSLKWAYHGATIGGMMLAGDWFEPDDYGLSRKGFYQISCPDPLDYEGIPMEEVMKQCIQEFESLVKKHRNEIGAIFMELIQLSNAANVLPIPYVQEMARICERENILLVFDEVATGFGRTGTMFSYQQYGVKSDLMMIAKGITSGYIPMGGVLATEEVYKTFWGEKEELCFTHGYTTGGHPVACAAALSNIKIIEERSLPYNAGKMGCYLMNKIIASCGESKLIMDVRGKGLMISIIFHDVKISGMEQLGIAYAFTKLLSAKGLLLYPKDVDILILAPPLTIEQKECDMIVETLKDCINEIKLL